MDCRHVGGIHQLSETSTGRGRYGWPVSKEALQASLDRWAEPASAEIAEAQREVSNGLVSQVEEQLTRALKTIGDAQAGSRPSTDQERWDAVGTAFVQVSEAVRIRHFRRCQSGTWEPSLAQPVEVLESRSATTAAESAVQWLYLFLRSSPRIPPSLRHRCQRLWPGRLRGRSRPASSRLARCSDLVPDPRHRLGNGWPSHAIKLLDKCAEGTR